MLSHSNDYFESIDDVDPLAESSAIRCEYTQILTATADLLKRIAGERSVVVVEHDMEFVRALGSRVTVLHEGAVLAEGSIDHVQNDQRVIEVYLGR